MYVVGFVYREYRISNQLLLLLKISVLLNLEQVYLWVYISIVFSYLWIDDMKLMINFAVFHGRSICNTWPHFSRIWTCECFIFSFMTSAVEIWMIWNTVIRERVTWPWSIWSTKVPRDLSRVLIQREYQNYNIEITDIEWQPHLVVFAPENQSWYRYVL